MMTLKVDKEKKEGKESWYTEDESFNNYEYVRLDGEK